ncbi:MAG TPA: hypothetical protein VKA87_08380 [Nitrososphaeraceae archaeon]|nr:hypothetical protein [Nitrososphaeraceae archaeon]
MLFNKNKKISSLTTAVIIISLSFLPLNVGGDHTSVLLPFSTKPVFAQLSGQSIPYGGEQLPTRPSSSSSPSPSAMDFGLFMDSFANSIFNGTSTFAGVGTSIVDGIDVSGIRLDKSQNKLSVTLSRAATTPVAGGGNNNITSTDTTITALNIPNSNSVSVIGMRIPISTSDILSIAAVSSSSPSLNAPDGSIGDDTTENQLNSFPSDSFNPFSLLSTLQIGSSALIDVGWSEPQTVTMDLVGSGTTNQEQQINSANETMADIVLVSVIPYTGLGNNATSSAT